MTHTDEEAEWHCEICGAAVDEGHLCPDLDACPHDHGIPRSVAEEKETE